MIVDVEFLASVLIPLNKFFSITTEGLVWHYKLNYLSSTFEFNTKAYISNKDGTDWGSIRFKYSLGLF